MADVRLLPGPIIDEWDWQLHGACRGMDSSFFFHPDGERGPRREHRASEAKKVCAACPVIEPCRRHALATREPYGVWGGLTEDERRLALRGGRDVHGVHSVREPEGAVVYEAH
jgi:WhiB family redox-sensing transcriptional regulator